MRALENPECGPPPLNDASHWLRLARHLWYDGASKLEELEKTITPALNLNAASPQHLNLVRENARLVVARFVRTWLMREQQWKDDKLTSVTVVFADETPLEGNLKPTLVYEPRK